MPKLKTHKSAKKRIGKRLKGRYVAYANSAQHRTTGKSKRVKQSSGKIRLLSKAENDRLAKLLPN